MTKTPQEAIEDAFQSALKVKVWAYVLRSNDPKAQQLLDRIKENIESVINDIEEFRK